MLQIVFSAEQQTDTQFIDTALDGSSVFLAQLEIDALQEKVDLMKLKLELLEQKRITLLDAPAPENEEPLKRNMT